MKRIDIISYFFIWITFLLLITLCWVGAEYLFEGVVHTSKVDAGFASILAFYMVRDINHFEQKMLEQKARGTNGMPI